MAHFVVGDPVKCIKKNNGRVEEPVLDKQYTIRHVHDNGAVELEGVYDHVVLPYSNCHWSPEQFELLPKAPKKRRAPLPPAEPREPVNLHIEEVANGFIVSVLPEHEGFKYTAQHVATNPITLSTLILKLTAPE